MKLVLNSLKESIAVQHGLGLGFAIYLGEGQITIRAKQSDEPDCTTTTVLTGNNVVIFNQTK